VVLLALLLPLFELEGNGVLLLLLPILSFFQAFHYCLPLVSVCKVRFLGCGLIGIHILAMFDRNFYLTSTWGWYLCDFLWLQMVLHSTQVNFQSWGYCVPLLGDWS
jgi:hypothetical protein